MRPIIIEFPEIEVNGQLLENALIKAKISDDWKATNIYEKYEDNPIEIGNAKFLIEKETLLKIYRGDQEIK